MSRWKRTWRWRTAIEDAKRLTSAADATISKGRFLIFCERAQISNENPPTNTAAKINLKLSLGRAEALSCNGCLAMMVHERRMLWHSTSVVLCLLRVGIVGWSGTPITIQKHSTGDDYRVRIKVLLRFLYHDKCYANDGCWKNIFTLKWRSKLGVVIL